MATDTARDPLALVREALAEHPAGLLADLDGTLAPIMRNPDGVRLADGAADALAALAERLAVVGLITGRAAADARRIAGTAPLLVVGNHGAEWLEVGADAPQPSPRLAELRPLLDGLLARVPVEPGVRVDHKGLSASVHYRNAPDPDGARRRIVAALEAALPAGIELGGGRMIVELRPSGIGDKGSALAAVVERYALRGLVVLGDDVTDLDMFRSAAALRAAGRLRAAIIAVGSGHEVSAAVHAAADASVPDPAAAVALLHAVARRAG